MEKEISELFGMKIIEDDTLKPDEFRFAETYSNEPPPELTPEALNEVIRLVNENSKKLPPWNMPCTIIPVEYAERLWPGEYIVEGFSVIGRPDIEVLPTDPPKWIIGPMGEALGFGGE